jgi:hypothetical protein
MHSDPSGSIFEADIVLLHLASPRDGYIPCVYPSGNRIGSTLLFALLTKALQAKGITITCSAYAGDLNNSIFTFYVDSLPAALPAIKAELEPFSLLPIAAIGFYDVNELIWRTWFTGRGGQLNPFFNLTTVIEENERYVAELQAAIAEIQKLDP